MNESIEKNLKVSIAYTLHNTDGQLIEEMSCEQPLVYLHGYENIIPGLEKALENRRIGDSFRLQLPPEDAYGSWEESLLLEVNKEELLDLGVLTTGMEIERLEEEEDREPEMFRVPQSPSDLYNDEDEDDMDEDEDEEEVAIYIVREIRDKTVILDGNHHLAGVGLVFDVQVVSVEPATFEEIEQGFLDLPEDSSPLPPNGPSLN